jgi:hypothetical protein
MDRVCRHIARIALCAILAISVLPGPAIARSQPAEMTAGAKQECVVYITRTGERFHIGRCRYLRQSRIPIEKREAIKGGYTPCKVCGGSDC